MIVKRWTEVLGVLLSCDSDLNQGRLFQLENEVIEMDEEAYVDGLWMMEVGWVEVAEDQLLDDGCEDDDQQQDSFRYDFRCHHLLKR